MYGGPIGTHQRSFGRYHPRPFMVSPSSRLGVCNLATPSYLRNRLSYGLQIWGYIYMAIPNRSPLKILEKMEHGRIQGVPNFLGVPPIISGTGKPRTSNLAGTFTRPIRIKAHKNLEKRERGRIQGLPNFFGTPYYLRNA